MPGVYDILEGAAGEVDPGVIKPTKKGKKGEEDIFSEIRSPKSSPLESHTTVGFCNIDYERIGYRTDYRSPAEFGRESIKRWESLI